MTVPQTLPHAFYTLLDQLQVDPTCDQVTCLAQHLVVRTASLTADLDEAYLPVGLFPHDRYQQLAPQLERARRYVQPFGLDLMSVPSVCVQGVLVYIHLQQDQGGAAWPS